MCIVYYYLFFVFQKVDFFTLVQTIDEGTAGNNHGDVLNVMMDERVEEKAEKGNAEIEKRGEKWQTEEKIEEEIDKEDLQQEYSILH